MKGKQMRHVHLYEDIVNYGLWSIHCICDMGYIFIAGANFMKFAKLDIEVNNILIASVCQPWCIQYVELNI